MLNTLIANLAKILCVIGVFFLLFKVFNRRTGNQRFARFYVKISKPFYQLHVNGSKFAIILGFIHGITIQPLDQIYLVTGWVLGIVMIILLALGTRMSIKMKSTMMTPEQDLEWRKIRYIKWSLTLLVLLLLIAHYFPMIQAL